MNPMTEMPSRRMNLMTDALRCPLLIVSGTQVCKLPIDKL
jgi:hypothetical protein